jgi:hypothetical protein
MSVSYCTKNECMWTCIIKHFRALSDRLIRFALYLIYFQETLSKSCMKSVSLSKSYMRGALNLLQGPI